MNERSPIIRKQELLKGDDMGSSAVLQDNKTISGKLTVKERLLVKGIVSGLSVAEAGRQAGYSENTIRGTLYHKLEKTSIKVAIQELMDVYGITDEKLCLALKEGLEATKLSPDGCEYPDHNIRLKYLETALRLKGHLDKKVDVVHHKSHEAQLRELQKMDVKDAVIVGIEAE